MGEDLCNLIKSVFENLIKIETINNMFIALIPKVEPVTFMKHFCPISLCNVSYNILSKIITLRLRREMEELVNPCLSSFIPNRRMGDNVIIAQEVIHSMKHKKGNSRWMAIKVDLEKVYDRLKWRFVTDTLKDIVFHEKFIHLIHYSISSSREQILWNGEALERFKPYKGVRQGDPISPYLFVLCIECLFHLINFVVDQKAWTPIQLARGGPKLSHLAFTDDLLLFSEASISQANTIKKVLDTFCASSGQKVNYEKTRIYFLGNVHWLNRNLIVQQLGYQGTPDLGKYLGVPLHHQKANAQSFRFIIDKLEQRLSCWKDKSLSFAGRLTLNKVVIQAMPTYIMQTNSIPESVCKDIVKYRNFIWGDSQNSRKVHWLNKKDTCKPKKYGSLGTRMASTMNQACMLKAGWNLCTKPNDL